jgi:6-pyruvoyltetrahydropterin/6-carboxytetrahydropterin synthase
LNSTRALAFPITRVSRHIHGHRYAIEVTLSGDVIAEQGAPEEGMVMDFSAVKAILQDCIVSRWDHAFLVYSVDRVVVDFLATPPGHKTVGWIACRPPRTSPGRLSRFLRGAYRDQYANHLRLERVRLYETPNCRADAAEGS